jgi:hypothetical protein
MTAKRIGRLALAGAVVVSTISLRVSAEEAKQAVATTEAPVPRPSEPLLTRIQTGGVILFGVSYGIALSIPVADGFSHGREWFALPLVGPPLGYAHNDSFNPWAIAFDELGQVGGIALLLAGDGVSWGSTASVTHCRSGGVCVGARGYF